MAAGTHNFTLEQGVDLTKTLTFYTDATRVTTIDLSTYTFRMQIRKEKNSVDTFDELTDANGRITTINAASGEIKLLWSAAQSAVLDFDTAYYDLELVTAGGVVSRAIQGIITLSKEVTR